MSKVLMVFFLIAWILGSGCDCDSCCDGGKWVNDDCNGIGHKTPCPQDIVWPVFPTAVPTAATTPVPNVYVDLISLDSSSFVSATDSQMLTYFAQAKSVWRQDPDFNLVNTPPIHDICSTNFYDNSAAAYVDGSCTSVTFNVTQPLFEEVNSLWGTALHRHIQIYFVKSMTNTMVLGTSMSLGGTNHAIFMNVAGLISTDGVSCDTSPLAHEIGHILGLWHDNISQADAPSILSALGDTFIISATDQCAIPCIHSAYPSHNLMYKDCKNFGWLNLCQMTRVGNFTTPYQLP